MNMVQRRERLQREWRFPEERHTHGNDGWEHVQSETRIHSFTPVGKSPMVCVQIACELLRQFFVIFVYFVVNQYP